METQGKLIQKLNWKDEPEARIVDASERLVAELDGYGSGSKAEAADTRRLVACWNACDGISTAVLEKGRVSSDAFQLEESRADKAEQHVEELLAALEAALEVLDNVQGNINPERGYADELEGDVSAAVAMARAAIAKAKGGAQ